MIPSVPQKMILPQPAWIDRPKPEVKAQAPLDIHDKTDLIGRIRLLLNLLPLIVQTDSSRVLALSFNTTMACHRSMAWNPALISPITDRSQAH